MTDALCKEQAAAPALAAKRSLRLASGLTAQLRVVRDSWVWVLPLLCSGLFLPCVTYSEWYIDELFAVLRNADARGEVEFRQLLTHDFWGNPLQGGSWTHKSYRPICVLSFAWQFWLLGGDLFRPQPLRAFNVALHAANSLLLLQLLRRGLGISQCWSCMAACLFAAHPVHTENVVYLVGRADMLATAGWLLAALFHLGMLRRHRCLGVPLGLASASLLVLFCTVLAVFAGLSKESGLMLLVFTVGVELSSPKLGAMGRRSGWGVAAFTLTVFLLLAAARFRITRGSQAAFGYVDTPVQYQKSREVRAWSYMFQHAYYLKLALLPGNLSWDYSHNALPLLHATWRDLRSLAVLTAYLFVVALTSWSLAGRGHRRVLLGLQHMLIPFLPASNLFFVVGVTVGERLLYPSTVGLAIVIASFGQHIDRHSLRAASRPAFMRWPIILGFALMLAYTYGCALRVGQWASSEALYAADAAAWPRSVKTRHQLGTVYHAQGRHEEALRHYEASLGILDDNALTDHCVAQIYIETGRYSEALTRFEKIMGGHGVGFSAFNLWMLYVDYGFTLVALTRFEEAVPALEYGLQRNTAVPHGLNAMGFARASLHQLQEAQDAFAKGLEYDPDNGIIWNNLAVVWMVAGALQQAAQGLEKALVLEPDHPSFVHNALLLRHAAQHAGELSGRPKLELFFSRAT